MEIDTYKKGEYQVFRIREDLGFNSDLSELRTRIEKHLSAGVKNFAIAFTQASYLYSKSIAVLIACTEIIRDAGGHLALIDANEDITSLLSVISLDKIIRLVGTEEDFLR